MPVNNYEPDFERECILVNKVYNECTVLIANIIPIPLVSHQQSM